MHVLKNATWALCECSDAHYVNHPSLGSTGPHFCLRAIGSDFLFRVSSRKGFYLPYDVPLGL